MSSGKLKKIIFLERDLTTPLRPPPSMRFNDSPRDNTFFFEKLRISKHFFISYWTAPTPHTPSMPDGQLGATAALHSCGNRATPPRTTHAAKRALKPHRPPKLAAKGYGLSADPCLPSNDQYVFNGPKHPGMLSQGSAVLAQSATV